MTHPVEFIDWTFEHWAYRLGKPNGKASFKQHPEDFIVSENLGFEPTQDGEHLLIHIEKSELNTQQVCEYLAKYFGKRSRDIGYAGLKDKQSIARQWFSVQMNRTQQPDMSNLEQPGIRLLAWFRHDRKLKIGALQSNHFQIRLRNVSEPEELLQRLQNISNNGVPNYFGLQRFGIKGNNLNWANRMATGEQIKNNKLRGFALSACRSYLFNELVSRRIVNQSMDNPLAGEVFMLSGSQSFFEQAIDNEIMARLQQKDIALSGPLFGAGELASRDDVALMENQVALDFPQWHALLIGMGMEQERRPLLLYPQQLKCEIVNEDALIEFDLPKGCFATAVLRECVQFDSEAEE